MDKSVNPRKRRSGFCEFITAGIIVLCMVVPSIASEGSLPQLIQAASPSIVTVVSYNPDLAMPGVGTGFFVAPDRIVTARHVIARADRATIRTSKGQTESIVGILAEERSSDLVLIQLKKAVDGVTPLVISPTAPDAGEHLFAVSSPLGLEFSASDGIVSAYRDVPGAGISMQHTVAVSAGSSGCPLLNMHGEVVAVQTGVITVGQRIVHAGQALNFAVSGKLIAKLSPGKLRTLKEAKDDVPPDWVPEITKGIDSISLHALTRDDFRSSLRFFEEAASAQPDEADAWFRIGICYEKMGDRDKAIDNYKKAVSLDKEFALAFNNLGAMYIQKQDYDAAAEALRKAIEVRKDYASAYSNLAVASVQASKWQEAFDAAKRAVELNGSDLEARLNLGTASTHVEKLDEARKQYDELKGRDVPRADRLKAAITTAEKAAGKE